MPWPDFLIIGFPRCGTTSLVRNLPEHPRIFVHQRETKFFEVPRPWHSRWARDREYKSLFVDGQINGEKTPRYISSPKAMERIRKRLPHARLIVCVRHPIRALHSFYHHRVNAFRRGRWGIDPEQVTFTELVLGERSEKRVGASTYCFADALRDNVLSRFERDRVHVVVQEEMWDNTSAALQTIHGFLHLEPHEGRYSHLTTADSSSSYSSIDMEVEAYPAALVKLIEFYEPENQRLFELLGRTIPEWESIDQHYRELAGL